MGSAHMLLALMVTALLACGDRSTSTSTTSGAASSSSSANGSASPAPSMGPFDAPSQNDVKATLRKLGYDGLVSIFESRRESFTVEVEHDGRKAWVGVDKPGVRSHAKAGSTVVPTKDRTSVQVLVTRAGAPDMEATSALARAIGEGAGQSPRAVEVRPASPPPFKLDSMLTLEKLKPFLEKLGYQEMGGSTSGGAAPNANAFGSKDGVFVRLSVSCAGAGTPATLEEQGAGEAVYFEGTCLMVAGAQKGGGKGDPLPAESKRLLESVLAAK